MSDRASCLRCGAPCWTAQGQSLITVNFTIEELTELAKGKVSQKIKRRVICVIGLLDPPLQRKLQGD